MDKSTGNAMDARSEFERAERDCRVLLKMLGTKIRRDAEKSRAGGIDWGTVGSIKHVRGQLKEALASMLYTANCDETEVHGNIEAEIKNFK